MAVAYRFQIPLTGFAGGPGVNTYHFVTSETVQDLDQQLSNINSSLEAIYNGLRTFMPSDVTASSPPEVEIFEIDTGIVIGYWAPTPWTHSGIDLNSVSARTDQAKMRFRTATVHKGRLVRGGVYFGPISDNALAGDGSINSSFVNAAAPLFENLLRENEDQPTLCVYVRPRGPDSEVPGPGMMAPVTAVSVSALPAVLRSRRD